MNYVEAAKIKQENIHLIGTSDEKGFTIGDIIILPTDENEKKLFFQSYLSSWDAESALFPFISSDLQVWTIDTNYLKRANILFYNKIG